MSVSLPEMYFEPKTSDVCILKMVD